MLILANASYPIISLRTVATSVFSVLCQWLLMYTGHIATDCSIITHLGEEDTGITAHTPTIKVMVKPFKLDIRLVAE